MAAALSTHVRQNVFMARARRYPDALTAALTPDHLPTSVFYTLIDTYKANIHIWHRYWEVRRRWLGLEELREYDVKAPLVPAPELSYAQAVDLICDGMQPLGAEYVSQMHSGLTTERWVDWASNAGKRQGAYSNGGARVKPYIFMSFQGGLGSYEHPRPRDRPQHALVALAASPGQQRAALHPVCRRSRQQFQSGDGAPPSL